MRRKIYPCFRVGSSLVFISLSLQSRYHVISLSGASSSPSLSPSYLREEAIYTYTFASAYAIAFSAPTTAPGEPPLHFSFTIDMNITLYTSEFTAHIFQISPSSIPGTLWACYVKYLWLYEPDSWVARIAYSCRVLAILVSLPIIVLGLLVSDFSLFKLYILLI
jgi:hypothetical protein